MLSSFNWFYLGSIVKKIAGNFPAVDGPGSYDQPNRNSVSVTVIICEKVRKINKIFKFFSSGTMELWRDFRIAYFCIVNQLCQPNASTKEKIKIQEQEKNSSQDAEAMNREWLKLIRKHSELDKLMAGGSYDHRYQHNDFYYGSQQL